MKSIQPGKQRRRLYNAPLHKKRKWLSSHLEENLLLKYDKRSIQVKKGDTVKIMRGSFKGHEDKVADVDVKKGFVQVEGVITVKADGKKIAKPLHPSNLLIIKLDLTDKLRRQKLERGLSEETKKEIEKEAEQQLKQAEEERIKAEKEKEAEALAGEAEEIEEEVKVDKEKEELKKETKVKTEKPKAKPKEKTTKAKPKPEVKKQVKKPEIKPEKKPIPKKPISKKTTPKKTTKKKPSKKKEEKK
jgi:large subunit ribosomal protein L24